MILQKTIDEVFEKMDIVEVIEAFVQLKRSGSNFKGLSPFSDERTPSFMVSKAKQIFKDFSSGKGGNAIQFLMLSEHMSYPEAIKYIANKYGIEILEEENEQERIDKYEREQIFRINDICQEFYSSHLSWLNDYLAQRQISIPTALVFGVGFAPNTLNALANKLITENGCPWDKCVLVGALGNKNNTLYDRFRNRIMFPIRSQSGAVLGFGGRDIDWQKGSNSAKYLNSSDSIVYHKSSILYGIFESKRAIMEKDHCYLSEGYTDVIGFHEVGIKNIIAASGTSFTSEQAKVIRKFCSKVTILFDGDKAGNQAAIRSIDYLIAEDISVKICLLPNGEDPDSFRKGKTADQILEYIKLNSKDFIVFKLNSTYKNDSDFGQKSQAINEIVATISKIKNAIQREVYLKECSRITEMDMVPLRVILNQNTDDNFVFAEIEVSQVAENDRKTRSFLMEECEQRILRYMLEFGNTSLEFREMLDYYDADWNEWKNLVEMYTMTVKEKIIKEIMADGLEFSNIDYGKIFHTCSNNDISDINQWNYIFGVELYPLVERIFNEGKKYEVSSFDDESLMTHAIIAQEKRDTLPRAISETLMFFKFLNIELIIEEMVKEPEPDIEMIFNYSDLCNKIKGTLNIVL